VTAIPIEFNAVTNCLSNKKTITEPESVYEVGEYDFDKKSAKIAVVQTGEGNSNSAIHTTMAICKFQPEVVIMVGIGGGVKDVKVGDVVVGQYVHYYEMGKDDGQKFLIRPRGYEPAQTLLTRAEAISRDVNKGWLNLIPDDSREDVHPSLGEPESFVKPIAAGEKIGASKKADLIKLITASYNDTVLIEMEGFGFQKAVHKAGKQGIVIRGVSDVVKQKSNVKEEIRQKIAVKRAAAFAFETLNLFFND
jgi:nucleoside phosphorylase